ncbi:MAG TPA: ArsR family transcriptional regulator [Gemmatimonadales bacterium]
MARGVPRSVLGGTKSRVVALLRRGSATALELARALRLTGNAVRAHLADLERDGLVVQAGIRRGRRKPAFLYALAADGQALVSRAYPPLLGRLLDVLEGLLSAKETARALRAAGARLALGFSKPTGAPRERAEGTIGVLRSLGAEARLAGSGRTLRIEGEGCPLSAIVDDHPQACLAIESLLETLLDLPVHEACVRGPGAPPRCRFSVGRAAG